jgi:MFS family permease
MLTKMQEFKRGWKVLLAAAFGAGSGVAPLTSYSMGALMIPLTMQFGWTRAEVSAVGLWRAIGSLAVGWLVGLLADRYGARLVAIVSQVLLVLAVAAMSGIDGHLWMLYGGYFLIAILGGGTLPITWSRAVTGWFTRARGLALGLSLIGTGVLGAALPFYINRLVSLTGWRGAYIGLAAVPLVLGIPLALLFFREPARDRHAPMAEAVAEKAAADDKSFTFRQAAGTLCFWQMAASFFLIGFAAVAAQQHAIPLMTDRGVSSATAAAVSGVFGLSISGGRLVSGYCLDIFGGPRVAFVLFIAPAIACLLLAYGGDNLYLCGAGIAMIGLSAGAEHDMAAFFVARYFGRAHYGIIYGLLYTLIALGGGLGPWVVAGVFDRYHNYLPALYVGIGVFILSAVLALTTRPPRERLRAAAAGGTGAV